MSQPDLSLYYQKITNYEQFLAFCLLAGLILAYFLYKSARPVILPTAPPAPPLWASVVLGALLRIPPLFQPMWYDETFTARMTEIPLNLFGIAITGDVHPPLYYLIVKIFTTLLGHHDLAMRLPAYISGLLLIVVMYHISHYMGKQTAFVVAILPAAIYYSTEARYPMFLALMLASGYLSLGSPDDPPRPWLFAATTTAAALVHVNAWFYVVVLVVVWWWWHRSWLPVVPPLLAVAAWLPIAVIQAADVSNGFWLAQYMPLRHLVEMLLSDRWASANALVLPAVGISALAFAGVWLWRLNYPTDRVTAWLAVVVVVPAAQWMVGILWHPIYLPRTLLISSLLILVPIVWAIWHYIRWGWGLLVVVLVAGIVSVYTTDRNGMADDAIALCDSYNLIYTTNVHSAFLAHHFSQADVLLMPGGNSTAQELPQSAQQALFTLGFLQPDQNACLYSQISVFNSQAEMDHIATILASRPHVSYTFNQSDLGYYLVTVFEEKLR